MIYVISKQDSSHVLARFPFVLSTRDGGSALQVQNLSWAIVLFKNKVPHQSCELDMQISHHPYNHGLWTHEGRGSFPTRPYSDLDENPFCGPAWSRTVTGI